MHRRTFLASTGAAAGLGLAKVVPAQERRFDSLDSDTLKYTITAKGVKI